MTRLYDNESGELIGTITAADLRFLIDQLEEEDSEDQDYYIDVATHVWFEEQGADSVLITLLREALSERQAWRYAGPQTDGSDGGVMRGTRCRGESALALGRI
jgi:hypothetical protein